jgi:HTH-type transcriptional regulator / antitoxin HipB
MSEIFAITMINDDSSNKARRIGTRVRDERRRQNMDQMTLALVANVGVSSVHRVERGDEKVRMDVLNRILSALGLELDVRSRGDSSA